MDVVNKNVKYDSILFLWLKSILTFACCVLHYCKGACTWRSCIFLILIPLPTVQIELPLP
jgi:hypothetical protein